MSLSLVFSLALACGVAFIIARVVAVYALTGGTRWQRLLATAKGSATILAQYVVIIGGAALVAIDKALDVLNLAETQALIRESVSPQVMGWVVVATAVLTIIARLRSLWSK